MLVQDGENRLPCRGIRRIPMTATAQTKELDEKEGREFGAQLTSDGNQLAARRGRGRDVWGGEHTATSQSKKRILRQTKKRARGTK